MKKNLLSILNTLLITGAVAGYFLLPPREQAPDPKAPPEAARPQVIKQRTVEFSSTDQSKLLAELKIRVADLETELKELRGQLAKAPTKAIDAPASTKSEDDKRAVTVGELDELIDKRIDERNKQYKKKAAKAWQRPKKTVKEMARELQLDGGQEQQVRDLVSNMEVEGIKLLFDIKDDAQLDQVRRQLEEAKYNPDLHAELREKISVNWTRRGSDIKVLYVQFDARLRRIMSPEQVATYYKHDVRLANPNFPNIQEMFFSPQKKDAAK